MVMDMISILAELVGFASVSGRPNAPITDHIRARLAELGVTCHVLPGPEGDRVNLLASIGPLDRPGYVLSGHTDVVPATADGWTSDPFTLTRNGDRLVGRGAVDMKGFLACMIAMVPEFRAMDLRRPVHLAFSYDEELGCRGVPHLLSRIGDLVAPPLGCIVGEPSGLQPVLSHKGKVAMELGFTGLSGHSSNPGLGLNAIYPAAQLAAFAGDLARGLEGSGPRDPLFDPPHSTLQVGTIHGGLGVNVIPDHCTMQVEMRTIPGETPDATFARLLAEQERLAAETGAGAFARELSRYPALAAQSPELAALAERISGQTARQSVSYGTEAGLFAQAGIPAIVCGPGSIDRAHKPDEYILVSEMEDCMAMLRKFGAALCG